MPKTICILEFERLWLLSLVRVFCTSIDKKLFVHGSAQFVLRQHASHTFFNNEFRFAVQHAGHIFPTLAAWIACVAHVFFL